MWICCRSRGATGACGADPLVPDELRNGFGVRGEGYGEGDDGEVGEVWNANAMPEYVIKRSRRE